VKLTTHLRLVPRSESGWSCTLTPPMCLHGVVLSWGEHRDNFTFTLHFISHDLRYSGYGLDDRGSRVRFPAGAGNFSHHHRVQTGSGTHSASYPMGTRGSFPGGKVAAAWSWPLFSIYWWDHNAWSYNSPPQYVLIAWCSVNKKHRDNFKFTFTFCTVSILVNSRLLI
jgi:hypothetical protein